MAATLTSGRRSLTRELYEEVLEAYRQSPGNHSAVAARCGIDQRTARRIWDGKPYKDYPWALQAKGVLDRENAERLRVRRAEERRRHDIEAAEREARRRAASEARGQDELAMKGARGNAIAVLRTAADLLPAIRVLSNVILDATKPGPDGKPAAVPLALALDVLNKHSLIAKRAVEMADRVIAMGRLERGLPTEIVGVTPTKELSYGDALAELEETEDLLASLKQLRDAGGLLSGGAPDEPKAVH